MLPAAMDPFSEFEALLREIEDLPPAQQMERLLDFFAKNMRTLDSYNIEVLMHHFRDKGTPEGETLADVLEGELAVRKIREA